MFGLIFALALGVQSVTDGDTFVLKGGEIVRISNIDAPEIFQPKCEKERKLGQLATRKLTYLFEQGEPVLQRAGRKDRYGRTLALVSVNGEDVGETLIADGLAVAWEGHRHAWCN